MVSARMYRLTVLREMPKRLAISRNGTWSRRCQRRIISSLVCVRVVEQRYVHLAELCDQAQWNMHLKMS